MRKYLVAALLCLPVIAAGEPKPKPVQLDPNAKPKPIDLKAKLDKLDVYKDELGNYYVSPKPDGAVEYADATSLLFFGDGKAMYQQRVIGSSLDGQHWVWNVWAPRARGLTSGMIELVGQDSLVECRLKDGKRPLTRLQADEASAMLKKASFFPPLWKRQAKFLARDDDGVYYFVDELREEYGGKGFRVFVGIKGAMKEMPMTNVVSDSAGELYATKTGQLKISVGADGKAVWIKAGKKTELIVIPPADNRYLIYRDLGIYGQLGAICEDL